MDPNDLLEKVGNRISHRLDSLRVLNKPNYKNHGLGFEAWFKIEVLNALESLKYSVRVYNKGPDLTLNVPENPINIELKCSNEPNNYAWIKNGLKKQKNANMCLFLMRHPEYINEWKDRLEKNEPKNFKLIYKVVNDEKYISNNSENKWVIGILRR